MYLSVQNDRHFGLYISYRKDPMKVPEQAVLTLTQNKLHKRSNLFRACLVFSVCIFVLQTLIIFFGLPVLLVRGFDTSHFVIIFHIFRKYIRCDRFKNPFCRDGSNKGLQRRDCSNEHSKIMFSSRDIIVS